MGLDGVELVMDVEDHFGVAIQDVEAERIRTVADLTELVASRIRNAHLTPCQTLSSFMRLRTCVRGVTENDSLKIRTNTLVVDVLNSRERIRFWGHLNELLGSPAPALRRPPVMRLALLCSVVIAFTLAIALAACTNLTKLPFNAAIASLFTLIIHLATVSFRSHPPVSISTFGSIARKVSGVTVATKRLDLKTDDEILAELKPIISDIMGISNHQIHPNSRFVEDLGIG